MVYVLSSLAALNEWTGLKSCSQPSQYPMSYKWHFILICRFPAWKWIIYKAELVGSSNQLPEIYTYAVSTLLLGEREVSHCPARSEDLRGEGRQARAPSLRQSQNRLQSPTWGDAHLWAGISLPLPPGGCYLPVNANEGPQEEFKFPEGILPH